MKIDLLMEEATAIPRVEAGCTDKENDPAGQNKQSGLLETTIFTA